MCEKSSRLKKLEKHLLPYSLRGYKFCKPHNCTKIEIKKIDKIVARSKNNLYLADQNINYMTKKERSEYNKIYHAKKKKEIKAKRDANKEEINAKARARRHAAKKADPKGYKAKQKAQRDRRKEKNSKPPTFVKLTKEERAIRKKRGLELTRYTPDGITQSMYSAQKTNSTRRGHKPPSYTLKAFRQWMYKQPNFQSLYDAWLASGRDTKLKPSCDRKNNDRGYTLRNIQLMTWEENRKLGHEVRLKAVLQISRETGEVIKRWATAQDVNKEHGWSASNIGTCCRGNVWSAYGYDWEYEQ